jgi:16S rRNA (uracil1498-N3)-methyltransferase
MRIPRFYCPIALKENSSVDLPENTFRHAIQVLRLNIGEALMVFNGEGGEYLATIDSISKRGASIAIQQYQAGISESPLNLTLAQAIIKPDKMDFALQKAVELGVSAIQPLFTERSVVRLNKESLEKKHSHWHGIMIAACEQSGRCIVPTLKPSIYLEDYLNEAHTSQRLILVPGNYPKIKQLPTPEHHSLELVIGPEGGFSDAEVHLSLQAGLQAISLGSRILRAETATLTSLALLQQQFGDL